MTIRQRTFRKRGYQEHSRCERTSENRLEDKRQKFEDAQRAYEDECVKKHGKRSTCDELGSFMASAAKGVGYAINKIGYAAQTMGQITEEDLYRHSPAGQRDRALMQMLREKGGGVSSSSRASGGGTRRARKPQYVIYTDDNGNPHVIPKERIQDPSPRRRRR